MDKTLIHKNRAKTANHTQAERASPNHKTSRSAWTKRYLCAALISLPLLVWAGFALAQRRQPIAPDFTQGLMGNPIQLMLLLGGMALLPFLLMMITSFVKIAVVLSIVRSALGTQQNPPTQVITGLAIILTVYVMAPLGVEIYGNVGPLLKEWSNISPPTPGKNNLLDPRMVSLVERITRGASEPVKRFLRQHSHLKERDMFYSIALQLQRAQESKQQKDSNRGQQPPTPHRIGPDDFLILIPSFVISELKEAFQIGFLIFLPFIIVDMVVANILLALGMHMLSPTTISLPFKLLLFVLVDGWYLITKGLVVGYL